MLTFLDWCDHLDAAGLLRLLETAAFFKPTEYNAVFDGELRKLLARLPDSDAKRQVMELIGFDFGSSISRSLQKAGFHDDDEQDAFHQVVVEISYQSWAAVLGMAARETRGFACPFSP